MHAFSLCVCADVPLGSRDQVPAQVHHAPDARHAEDIVAQRCKDWGGELIEFNGETDHVHALVSLPPNLDLSRFVNNVKTTSSRLVRSEFGNQLRRVYRKPVFWSRSYCIISFGGALLSVIKQYVEQQSAPE